MEESREVIGGSALQVGLFESETVRYRDLDQFYTEPKTARRFIEWCQLDAADRILEPTVGEGALLAPMPNLANVTAFDIDHTKVEVVRKRYPSIGRLEARDYLGWTIDTAFDVVVMNPPYRNELDARCIERAVHHAPRVCALVRTVFLNGDERSTLCHDHVIYTRIEKLRGRPNFGGEWGAMADFMFLECRKRRPGEKRGVHYVEMTTGR